MAQEPKPKRGMARSLIYALIPGGFILFVLFAVMGGFAVQEEQEVEMVPVLPEAAQED